MHFRPWLCSAVFALLLAPLAHADEGMFLLYEGSKLPMTDLQKRGLSLSVPQLQTVGKAIVQIARGGTGSFVSKSGLIVTNHHVAYSCLAALDATTHKGLMRNGYVAASRSQELPCPATDLLVVKEVVDVTTLVESALKPQASAAPAAHKRPKPPKLDERAKAIRIKTRSLEAACEKEHKAICQVRALNHGAAWSMSIYHRLRDIRLVYAPAGTLGKFGGDIDNWRYPRHTADFTFLRAYASPQGLGLPYKATNVPYTSKHFLRIARKGIQKGDLTLVLGFPGSTYRHTTVSQAVYQRTRGVVKRAHFFRKLLAALPKDDLTRPRYQSLRASLNNSAKYYEDLQEQFDKFRVLEQKEIQQKAIQKRLASDPKRLQRYERMLRRIQKIYKGHEKVDEKALLLHYFQSPLFRSLHAAIDIVRWSQVRRMTDLERPGERYRDKELFRVHQGLEMVEKLTTSQGEKALLLTTFRYALSLPASQQLQTAHWLQAWGRAEVEGMKERAAATKIPYASLYAAATRQAAPTDDPLQAAIDLLYGQTALYAKSDTGSADQAQASVARRLAFTSSEQKLRRSTDPLLQLAFRLLDELDALSKGSFAPYERTLFSSLLPALVKEVIQPPYWDANFTLRLNFGEVVDYHETKKTSAGKSATTTHRYTTDLGGLMAKVTDKDPFEIPAPLRAIVKAKDWGRWQDPVIKDVPVNFTTTLDTTGGNSGSPVLNGRGELIGLLFDGTPEAILSDWLFLPPQRSIVMDIRFALFLADRLDKATTLLDELGFGK